MLVAVTVLTLPFLFTTPGGPAVRLSASEGSKVLQRSVCAQTYSSSIRLSESSSSPSSSSSATAAPSSSQTQPAHASLSVGSVVRVCRKFMHPLEDCVDEMYARTIAAEASSEALEHHLLRALIAYAEWDEPEKRSYEYVGWPLQVMESQMERDAFLREIIEHPMLKQQQQSLSTETTVVHQQSHICEEKPDVAGNENEAEGGMPALAHDINDSLEDSRFVDASTGQPVFMVMLFVLAMARVGLTDQFDAENYYRGRCTREIAELLDVLHMLVFPYIGKNSVYRTAPRYGNAYQAAVPVIPKKQDKYRQQSSGVGLLVRDGNDMVGRVEVVTHLTFSAVLLPTTKERHHHHHHQQQQQQQEQQPYQEQPSQMQVETARDAFLDSFLGDVQLLREELLKPDQLVEAPIDLVSFLLETRKSRQILELLTDAEMHVDVKLVEAYHHKQKHCSNRPRSGAISSLVQKQQQQQPLRLMKSACSGSGGGGGSGGGSSRSVGCDDLELLDAGTRRFRLRKCVDTLAAKVRRQQRRLMGLALVKSIQLEQTAAGSTVAEPDRAGKTSISEDGVVRSGADNSADTLTTNIGAVGSDDRARKIPDMVRVAVLRRGKHKLRVPLQYCRIPAFPDDEALDVLFDCNGFRDVALARIRSLLSSTAHKSITSTTSTNSVSGARQEHGQDTSVTDSKDSAAATNVRVGEVASAKTGSQVECASVRAGTGAPSVQCVHLRRISCERYLINPRELELVYGVLERYVLSSKVSFFSTSTCHVPFSLWL